MSIEDGRANVMIEARKAAFGDSTPRHRECDCRLGDIGAGDIPWACADGLAANSIGVIVSP